MIHLNDFVSFDVDRFFKDKVLLYRKGKEWKDDKTGIHLGTRVSVAIHEDNTQYEFKDGEEEFDNSYETFIVKVKNDVKFAKNTPIVLVNATAKVWGDYDEKLSVTADNIQPAQPKQQPTKTTLTKGV